MSKKINISKQPFRFYTRHLRDYMLLFLFLEHPNEDIISL